MNHSIETYQLHAYIDGELSRDEAIEVEKALEIDTELRAQLEELNLVKNKVRLAYATDIPQTNSDSINKQKLTNDKGWVFPKAAVASLFLGLLLGAGLLKVYTVNHSLSPAIEQGRPANYLVHLDSDSIEKQHQALIEIESLLESAATDVKVELISNSDGIQLFDINNPNSAELNRLLEKYDNLALLACKRALERAKERGKPINIMPQVKHDMPAIDTVVDRLNSGWNYIKI